jgi:spoIIIJ-associated protein
MMTEMSREFSAKTVEAAIEEGLRLLNARRDQVTIEVLHEGSRGLLGIGSSNARVRITLPDPSASPVQVAPTAPKVSPVEAAPPPAAPDQPAQGASPEPVAVETAAPAPVSPPAPQADTSDDAGDDDAGYEDGDEDEETDEDGEYETPVSAEELESISAELLEEMLSLMGFDCAVDASWGEDDSGTPPLVLNVQGDDLGMLIGRHGETLASIQYLIRLMVNQRIHRWTNIVVDVNSYKARRAEQLQQMAERLADQVVTSGRAVALEPMPPNERRLVHMSLRNHPQVITQSTGEGDRRKVQILPKR